MKSNFIVSEEQVYLLIALLVIWILKIVNPGRG